MPYYRSQRSTRFAAGLMERHLHEYTTQESLAHIEAWVRDNEFTYNNPPGFAPFPPTKYEVLVDPNTTTMDGDHLTEDLFEEMKYRDLYLKNEGLYWEILGRSGLDVVRIAERYLWECHVNESMLDQDFELYVLSWEYGCDFISEYGYYIYLSMILNTAGNVTIPEMKINLLGAK